MVNLISLAATVRRVGSAGRVVCHLVMIGNGKEDRTARVDGSRWALEGREEGDIVRPAAVAYS